MFTTFTLGAFSSAAFRFKRLGHFLTIGGSTFAFVMALKEVSSVEVLTGIGLSIVGSLFALLGDIIEKGVPSEERKQVKNEVEALRGTLQSLNQQTDLIRTHITSRSMPSVRRDIFKAALDLTAFEQRIEVAYGHGFDCPSYSEDITNLLVECGLNAKNGGAFVTSPPEEVGIVIRTHKVFEPFAQGLYKAFSVSGETIVQLRVADEDLGGTPRIQIGVYRDPLKLGSLDFLKS